MTPRERLRAMAAGEPLDRGLLWPETMWPETRARWLAEGMGENPDFGFDPCDVRPKVEIGYVPPWETGTVADEGEHLLIRDVYGIIRRISKAGRQDIAQYVSFPVAGRADWERLAPRLAADAAGRFPPGWEDDVLAARRRGEPITVGGGHLCGFFSFLRELFGDEEVYYLLADDPGLVDEIMAFQVERLTGILERICAVVPVDKLFIWEDMCYKNGPLVGPAHFERFFSAPYARYVSRAKELGVAVVDVDSDGRVDELLPLWIAAGVTMLHPFEVQSGMDVNAVLAHHGERLIVRGGIDKRELAKGRAAIDREMERIRPAYETGRYVPCADHSIPPDVSYADFRYYLDRRAELVGA